MRVLITRPIEDANATAEILRARGHVPVIAPLLEIRYRAGIDIPSDARAILATSANGVRALAKATSRRDLSVFAVGIQTAEAASLAGFADVSSADGDANDLARLIVASNFPKSQMLIHAAGAETRGDIAGALRCEGFSVQTVTLYDAIAAAEIPVDLGTLDAALFYSPRGAGIFAKLAHGAASDKILACCISAATADALKSLQFREVRVATRPNQENLLALLR